MNGCSKTGAVARRGVRSRITGRTSLGFARSDHDRSLVRGPLRGPGWRSAGGHGLLQQIHWWLSDEYRRRHCTARAEVVNDRRQIGELTGGIGPDVSAMSFLRARRQHLYRRFIGVNYACASRPAVGMPLSITCGGTGAWISVSHFRQAHFPRTCCSTVNTPGV